MEKTPLEKRIEELERELEHVEAGSEAYELITKDLERLYKCLNDRKRTEMDNFVKTEQVALEKSKAIDEALDKEKRTEIERKSKSIKSDIIKIAAGTWVPFLGYMFWEEKGRIWAGKALQWIQKPK